jgi:hypothetical protein
VPDLDPTRVGRARIRVSRILSAHYPSMRLELWKATRSHLQPIPRAPSPDWEKFKTELTSYFTRQIDEWHALDSGLMLIGGVLLGFYFVFQGVAKLDLATKTDVASGVLELRTERLGTQIEDLRRQMEELGKK